MVRARRFARAQGISDGLDVIVTRPLGDVECHTPEAERALRRFGGVDGIIERARDYVGATDDGAGERWIAWRGRSRAGSRAAHLVRP